MEEVITLFTEQGITVAIIIWFMTIQHKEQKTTQTLLSDFRVSLEKLINKVGGLNE